MPSLPDRTLFAQLIDDAAVFPPGDFPLPEAIARRGTRRGTTASDFVGPLLLPPRLVDQSLTTYDGLVVAVVARRGDAVGTLVNAASRVAESSGHSLAGVELYADPGWEQVLPLSVPVALEVPAGAQGVAALADLQRYDGQVIAKLRTGPTEATPAATAEDLARFIAECARLGLPFKLTGGLHRAIAHAGDGADHFGFLNVLLATHAALDDGDVGQQLDRSDAEGICTAVRSLTEAAAARTRDLFTSFGCCDVLDPVRDLAALGLIRKDAI